MLLGFPIGMAELIVLVVFILFFAPLVIGVIAVWALVRWSKKKDKA